jgi:hypothetical protein
MGVAAVSVAVSVLVLAFDATTSLRASDATFGDEPSLAGRLAIAGIALVASTGLLASLVRQRAVDVRTVAWVFGLAAAWSVADGSPVALGVAGFVLLIRSQAPLDRPSATLGTAWAAALCAGSIDGFGNHTVEMVALALRGLSYALACGLAVHNHLEISRVRGRVAVRP